jgi:hypothetical protein
MPALVALVGTLALFASLGFGASRVSVRWAKRLWLILFVVVVGGGVTQMTAHSFLEKWAFRGDAERYGLLFLMDGTAHRPFVYRRLAPEAVNALTNVLLKRLPDDKLDRFTSSSPLKRYRVDQTTPGLESWTPRKAVAFHVAFALVWLSLFGTLIAAAFLLKPLCDCRWPVAFVISTLAMALIPLMFVGGGYLYDATELLLWTTLLAVAIRGWFSLTLLLFILMLFNKESAVFTIPALCAIFVHRLGWWRALSWTVAAGALGGLWLIFSRAHFSANPGQQMEWHLAVNLAFWSNPTSYFKLGSFFAPALPSLRGANILLIGLVFLPFRFGWARVRRDIRWAAVLTGLVLVPICLMGANRDEVRNFSLLFPLWFVVSANGIYAMYGQTAQSRESARSSLD